MRRPSDRAELWRAWSEHVAPKAASERRRWRWSPDEPICGRYMAKRRGQWCAVQIDIQREVDEDGELVGDETFVAWLGADKFEGERVFDIWERCGARPISDEEYKRLLHMPAVDDLSRSVIT